MADNITSDGSVYATYEELPGKKKLNLNLTKDLDPITNIQEIQRTKEHVIR